MNLAYSKHIFMFPFQWKINNSEKSKFEEQVNIDNIKFTQNSNWKHTYKPETDIDKTQLYNEKNYFFEFVHDALYDSGESDSIVKHYERIEPQESNVQYKIIHNDNNYSLKVESINLNFYATGVGVLTFYLENDKYTSKSDILNINQYGRRVYPPFFADIQFRNEIANSLEISGLNGVYYENFEGYTYKDTNNPCSIILNLINELATNITIDAVIDDRMFTMSWYRDQEQEFNNKLKTKDGYSDFLKEDFWYQYVHIDNPNSLTCQNDKMQANLIAKRTYERWQKWGTLFGTTMYSMVMYSNAEESEKYLYDNFESMYVRMSELCLVQKASILRFSAEVKNLSRLQLKEKNLAENISSLYKEYIRFVNQIHFYEVSAQDQGLEMYNILYEELNIKDRVEKLDREIEELHNYLIMKEDNVRNKEMGWLTVVATVFVPISFITGFFGMNSKPDGCMELCQQGIIISSVLIASVIYLIIKQKRNRNKL